MSETERYINSLRELKPGALGLLRTHAGKSLDETVDGFDLFAGVWWPRRQKSQFAPRRSVAWLIAKLYAFRPIEHSRGDLLARQLRKCQPREERERFQKKFDEMLTLPLGQIEPALQWALDCIASRDLKLDWVKLTDDLSRWEKESTRLEWAEQFLTNK
jgi:CRISPR type I-E-associated protein CasB/Cse2